MLPLPPRMTALSLLVALLVGCQARSSGQRASTPASPSRLGSTPSTLLPSGLRVDVHVGAPMVERHEDLRVLVSIGSQSGATVRMNGVSVDVAKVMLAAQGSESIPLRPGIPPVPTGDEGDAGRIVFKPVESLLLEYAGTSYLAQPLAPGRYLVQFRLDEKNDQTPGGAEGDGKRQSGWIALEVKH